MFGTGQRFCHKAYVHKNSDIVVVLNTELLHNVQSSEALLYRSLAIHLNL